MENVKVIKSGTQATQSSIRSFFQSRAPINPPPPSPRTIDKHSNTSVPASHIQQFPVGPLPSLNPQSAPPSTLKSSGGAKFTHPRATISKVEEKDIQSLRRINALILPVNYPDNFYQKILDPTTHPNFSRVILWKDEPSSLHPKPDEKVVGGVVCRVEEDDVSKTASLYIQSLALLSPYRSKGLATAAIEDIIASTAQRSPEALPITNLYAHVWTENEEAFTWYGSRGFSREGPVLQGYYRRLNPDTAFVVRRTIKPSDYLRQSAVIGNVVKDGPSFPTASDTLHPKPALIRGSSYQTTRPATEWNDLPSDILAPSRTGTPKVASQRPSPNTSTASLLMPETNGGISRSASRARDAAKGGKKKRQYPAAAFGTTPAQ